jgi:hypothetical protein
MTDEYRAFHQRAQACLPADKNKDAGGECQDSHNHNWDRDRVDQQTESCQDEINRE